MRTEIEADIFDDIIDDLLTGRSLARPSETQRRKIASNDPPKQPHIDVHHSTAIAV